MPQGTDDDDHAWAAAGGAAPAAGDTPPAAAHGRTEASWSSGLRTAPPPSLSTCV
jgi:hypothetical protein